MSRDVASDPGTEPPAGAAVPGFDDFFTASIEPAVRLPKGLGEGSPRANALALGSAVALAAALLGYLLDAPRLLYAAATLVGAATLLGALQLRMGGNAMGLAEARAHVLASVAQFLGLHHEPSPDPATLHAAFADAGAMADTILLRRTDLLASAPETPRWVSIQILGGIFLARDPATLPQARWLGIPVTHLTERFTVDGLLARIELSRVAAVPMCVSSDLRLGHHDKGTDPATAGTVRLVAPSTGDAEFDSTFRLVGDAPELASSLLQPRLCQTLSALNTRLGPVTLFVTGDRAFLSVWVIGDLYELTSLGSDLPRQARQIAWLASAPERLATALDEALITTAAPAQ